jgi:SAM-dependent methyltransferase
MKELSKRVGYTDYSEGYYGLDIHRYNQKHEDFTAKSLELAKNKSSVLDVGCGDGFWSNMLSKYYSKVTGIDPSISGIETARARYPELTFYNIDLDGYNEKHDVVFIRGMSLQNQKINTKKFRELIDKLFSLAKKEVIYIERSLYPELDPGYWHYKNPELLYKYMAKYGEVTLAKYTRNTVFIRIKK